MDQAFIRTIIANPDDDAPRLVYADWLDETGETANVDRAEFIRLQIRLETLPTDAPEHPALTEREKALLKKYAKKWAEPFREIVSWWTFRRGFVESAVVRTEGMRKTFQTLFGALVERTPLREVILFEQTDDISCLLPAAPLMTRLRSFGVRGGFLYSSGHILRKLFESKHLSGLRRLELECARSHSWFRPRTLSALLQSPVLAKLTDLSLADYITSLHPTVVRTLARSKSLPPDAVERGVPNSTGRRCGTSSALPSDRSWRHSNCGTAASITWPGRNSLLLRRSRLSSVFSSAGRTGKSLVWTKSLPASGQVSWTPNRSGRSGRGTSTGGVSEPESPCPPCFRAVSILGRIFGTRVRTR